MKILIKEPEEIKCPLHHTSLGVTPWIWGKQAVLDQMVDVDLDEMFGRYILDCLSPPGRYYHKAPTPTEYLKEQLEGKHEDKG